MKTKSLLIVGVVLASFLIAASSRAANFDRMSYLTLNRATALPGVVLAPGSYVFEAVEGHPDIVRVSDRATNRVLYLGYTDIIARPQGATNRLSFGEAPSGQPVPITAWFPTGARNGNAFRHR